MKLLDIEGKCIYKAEVSSIKELVERAVREGVSLSGVKLSGVDLRGADLSGANLSGVFFSWDIISGVNLSGANLSNADFRLADLSGTCLSEATLTGAILSCASANVIGDGVYVRNIEVKDATYGIAYTAETLAIGCEHHTVDEWEHFSDKDIIAMDGRKALKYWKANKKSILDWVKKHPAKSTKEEE